MEFQPGLTPPLRLTPLFGECSYELTLLFNAFLFCYALIDSGPQVLWTTTNQHFLADPSSLSHFGLDRLPHHWHFHLRFNFYKAAVLKS